MNGFKSNLTVKKKKKKFSRKSMATESLLSYKI